MSAQGKLLQNVDQARIKKSPLLLTFPTCRSMTDQNASKCLPLQSIDRPIPLYQQQGSNRVGNDMSTRKIYFYVPLAPVEEFMERIGFPAHWWVPARGSLAPPIVPCLCWSPPGTYLPTISPVLSSPGVHTQAPVLHNRTNAPPFSLARWGRTALGQNEPNRPNWMTGTYLHISQRPQLPVLFNFVFFAIVAHK